jgi:hypothetical protein
MTFDVRTGQVLPDRAVEGRSNGGRRRARPSRPVEWPVWAVPQLTAAAELAEQVSADGHLVLASELYRRWFNPVVGPGAPSGRPLAGLYRAAHAGSASRVTRDGVVVIDRHDVVGRDGWWRTWNDTWLPTRSRTEAVRVLLAPRPELLGEFVRTVTGALRATRTPWLLACTTDPTRTARLSAATLYVQNSAALPDELTAQLRPLLREVTPPLSLPLVAGAGLAQAPGNGMSFGEHRCHLVALALRTAEARQDPLASVAHVFRQHRVDPARPYSS